MDLAFASIPGALGGAVYTSEEVAKVPASPAAPTPAPKPMPQVPPPCWDTRPIDPDVCESATRAMCGG